MPIIVRGKEVTAQTIGAGVTKKSLLSPDSNISWAQTWVPVIRPPEPKAFISALFLGVLLMVTFFKVYSCC